MISLKIKTIFINALLITKIYVALNKLTTSVQMHPTLITRDKENIPIVSLSIASVISEKGNKKRLEMVMGLSNVILGNKKINDDPQPQYARPLMPPIRIERGQAELTPNAVSYLALESTTTENSTINIEQYAEIEQQNIEKQTRFAACNLIYEKVNHYQSLNYSTKGLTVEDLQKFLETAKTLNVMQNHPINAHPYLEEKNKVYLLKFINNVLLQTRKGNISEMNEILYQMMCDININTIAPSFILQSVMNNRTSLTTDQINKLIDNSNSQEITPPLAHYFPPMGKENTNSFKFHLEEFINSLPKSQKDPLLENYSKFIEYLKDVSITSI